MAFVWPSRKGKEKALSATSEKAIEGNEARGRGSGRRERGMTKVGKWWIWFTVVYGAISIVLWAGFYPPA